MSSGRLVVDPIGSRLDVRTIGGPLHLDAISPELGERSLEIRRGATLLLENEAVVARHVGVGVGGGEGAIEVVDVGGLLETGGRLGLGATGSGRLEVRDGGQVRSAEAVLGEVEAQGSALVHGNPSGWKTGNLAVGLADDAALDIAAGGLVESDSAYVDCQLDPDLAQGAPGCSGLAGDERAKVALTGSGEGRPSTWKIGEGTGTLEIGARGKVSVADGALLEAGLIQIGTSGDGGDCISGLACLEVTGGRVTAGGVAVGAIRDPDLPIDSGSGKLRIGSAGRVTSSVGLAAGVGTSRSARSRRRVGSPPLG